MVEGGTGPGNREGSLGRAGVPGGGRVRERTTTYDRVWGEGVDQSAGMFELRGRAKKILSTIRYIGKGWAEVKLPHREVLKRKNWSMRGPRI